MVQSWPPKRARHVRQAAKDVKANYATALCEAGSVYFPKDAGWLYEWERELLTFTGARNDTDDQVDTFSMAAILISEGHIGRPRQSLAGWRIDPDLQRPGLSGSYSYDIPTRSPNIGP
jgi:hypothetical protein